MAITTIFNFKSVKVEEQSDLQKSFKGNWTDLKLAYPESNQIKILSGSVVYANSMAFKFEADELVTVYNSTSNGVIIVYIEPDYDVNLVTLDWTTSLETAQTGRIIPILALTHYGGVIDTKRFIPLFSGIKTVDIYYDNETYIRDNIVARQLRIEGGSFETIDQLTFVFKDYNPSTSSVGQQTNQYIVDTSISFFIFFLILFSF